MENTPMGCADDLSTIMGIYKNDSKSKSVHNSLQQLDFDPDSIKGFVCQPKTLTHVKNEIKRF